MFWEIMELLKLKTMKRQGFVQILMLKNCAKYFLDPETEPEPKPDLEPEPNRNRNWNFSKIGTGTTINQYGSTSLGGNGSIVRIVNVSIQRLKILLWREKGKDSYEVMNSDWYYQSIGDKYLTFTNRFFSIIFLCYSNNKWYKKLDIWDIFPISPIFSTTRSNVFSPSVWEEQIYSRHKEMLMRWYQRWIPYTLGLWKCYGGTWPEVSPSSTWTPRGRYVSRPEIEPGSPEWQASTQAKNYSNSNIYLLLGTTICVGILHPYCLGDFPPTIRLSFRQSPPIIHIQRLGKKIIRVTVHIF